RRRSSVPVGEGGCEPYELIARHGLPRRGFASPLGFWFAPAEDWASPPPYRVEMGPIRRPGARVHSENGMPGIAEGRRLVAVVAPSRRRGGAAASPASLALEVAGRRARIEIDEAACPAAREAGLLAVATCWRLEALDGALDRLTDQARLMLGRRDRRAPARPGGPAPSWRGLHH